MADGCEEETGMSEMELGNPVDGRAPGKCERSQKVDTSEDIGSGGGKTKERQSSTFDGNPPNSPPGDVGDNMDAAGGW